MTLRTKQFVVATLGIVFLGSLLFVQWMEVERKREEAGVGGHRIAVPASSKSCVDCHQKTSPGVISHWTGSTHAEKGVGCVECHKADAKDVDAFDHYGAKIATIVSPMDCGRCHVEEYKEFSISHHAKAGNILASLDNLLAETVEGSRTPFNPHSPTPGMDVKQVNGMASAEVGCKQCHGSKVALESTDGGLLTVTDFKPGPDGKPTDTDAVAKIKRDASGRPLLSSSSWPNTGIGRLNFDGSLGSCSACHSRHDFSPRRARQPENCGKCHLGPDHPQKEIYEESKHGVAFRDLMLKMNLDSKKWVLGEDYAQAPTCATCHMSANTRNGRKVTHNAGQRISWTNRPPVSLLLDTDETGEVVKETDPEKRKQLVVESWTVKRDRMKQVCTHCHTENYVNAFYKQYDEFVINYNEKFAKPGQAIMASLRAQNLLTPGEFDEEIEWTWFYLWHHEGRRARHGASMMAPDYAHWHGMFEVAERFYKELVPQARHLADKAEADGNPQAADAVRKVINEILERPEHVWFESQMKQREKKPDIPEKPEPQSNPDAPEKVDTQDSDKPAP
jgi:hydroxylamine dehydrogenase